MALAAGMLEMRMRLFRSVRILTNSAADTSSMMDPPSSLKWTLSMSDALTTLQLLPELWVVVAMSKTD